jgi:hypothetical protein
LENAPILALTPSDTTLIAGETLTVRVSVSPIGVVATGVQLAIRFDPSEVMLLSADPASGAPFTAEVVKAINNTNGTLQYTLGLAGGASGTAGSAQLADLQFIVLPGASVCNEAGAVVSAAVGAYTTKFTTTISQDILPIAQPLPAVTLDGLDPVFANLPSSASIASDAGSTLGGTIVNPVVTASDNCDGSVPVSIAITYPDSSTATTWPSGGVFPRGISTVTWSATDVLGNLATETRTFTVENHQLLDVQVGFVGVIAGNTSRTIRVTAGSTVEVRSVALTGANGSMQSVQLPVASSYPCVAVKNTTHSITDAVTTSILSNRYKASVSLIQGDSNDDDVVDITDFAMYVGSRGSGKAVDAVSNFNGDTVINTVDFTYIGVNFLKSGEACGAFNGPIARDRISVRELRRTGLGELIQADLNGDGWVDLDDMQHYMQFGGQ